MPWALAVLGSEYTAFLYLGGGGRLLPVYAAAFVLVAELAYWALEPRSVADDAASLALRTATVALTTAVAGALGALLASVSNEEVSGGLGIEAAGIAAAVVALGLVAGLAHRRVRQEGLERAVRERDGA